MSDDSRYKYLRWSWCGFVVLLIVATGQLWINQHVFPQIPLLSIGHWLPPQLDIAFLAVACISCVTATLIHRQSAMQSVCYLTFAAAFVLLFVTDQHRLQPWAFEFVLVAVVFALCDRFEAMKLFRWLIIGIYIYSAVSKIDAAFFASVGRELAAALCGFVAIDWTQLPTAAQNAIVGCFPAVELAVGISLIFSRGRRVAVIAAMLMHLGLLLVLSPLGLGHKYGVLCWNLCFLVQVPLLFWPTRSDKATSGNGQSSEGESRALTVKHRQASWFARAVIVLALIVPAFEPWDGCDHWIAWGLYAPRSSRVDLFVHSNQLGKIPDLIPREESETWQGWHRIDMSEWSLATLSVPIYPQSRFQLGVAEALIEQTELDESGIRLYLKSVSGRWTGARDSENLSRTYQRKIAAERFWFGATPRR